MNRPTKTQHPLPRLFAALLFAAAAAVAEEKQCASCRIVISIPDHKLALLDGERLVRLYDVATGKPSTPSPRGEFRVVTRVPHPTWYGPHKVVGPGASNPLGTRWMGLSVAGYGIHGTNRPASVGKSASHGCIRMRNRDVEELFELVNVGVSVELLEQPSEQIEELLTETD